MKKTNFERFNKRFERSFFIAKRIVIIFISLLILPLAISFWLGFYIAKRITENKYEVVRLPKRELRKSLLPYDSNKSEKEEITHGVFI